MKQKINWMLEIYINKRLSVLPEAFLILYWINFLSQTSAHYIIYLIFAGLAFCFLGIRISRRTRQTYQIKTLALAGVFSLMVVLGNHDIFQMFGFRVVILFRASMLFCGGLTVFYNIFEAAYDFFLRFENKTTVQVSKKDKLCFFFFPFTVFVLIDLIYLFVAAYPGVLSTDSINQMNQIASGVYSNHHPFYHTMLIKLFYELGMSLFHDVNAAVATYSVFQIILMSLVFAYVTLTVYEMTASNIYTVLVMCFYALMPYYWNYSCTMWKDVVFGIAVTAFVVSVYRSRRNIGNKSINYALVFLSAIGFCLFRSNGVFAYIITLIAFGFVFWKKQKGLLSISIIALVLALVMKGPVLDFLGVSQPDLVEALSIPVQQIARVIYYDNDVDEIDLERLDRIVDVEAVKEKYEPYLSDPIKNLIRESSGNEVLVEHKWEYISLWVRLGLRYPATYIVAWIEQTKGYWNAGYDYYYCTIGVRDNKLGIFHEPGSEWLFEFTKRIIYTIQHNSLLSVLVSIGFCFWLYLILFWFNITGKRDGWIETVPFIAIIISLCVATPVFSEFRYSYALYAALPFVIFSGLFRLG